MEKLLNLRVANGITLRKFEGIADVDEPTRGVKVTATFEFVFTPVAFVQQGYKAIAKSAGNGLEKFILDNAVLEMPPEVAPQSTRKVFVE
mgnify:CR=1 FL=1